MSLFTYLFSHSFSIVFISSILPGNGKILAIGSLSVFLFKGNLKKIKKQLTNSVFSATIYS